MLFSEDFCNLIGPKLLLQSIEYEFSYKGMES